MHLTRRLESFDITACAAVMSEDKAPKTALAMRDLYLECVQQVIKDGDVSFHALMMPTMKGGHFIYTVTDDGLDTDVSDILGVSVQDGDCIVLLDSNILETDRTEHEMLMVVIADIAIHVSRTWRVPEPKVCPMGGQIGWSAVAATISAAHDAIHLHPAREEINAEIRSAAGAAINRAATPQRLRPGMPGLSEAMATIEAVCEKALEKRGNYLSLPAPGQEIADCARAILIEVLDDPSTFGGVRETALRADIR